MAFPDSLKVAPYASTGASTSGINPSHVENDHLVALFVARIGSASFVTPTQDGGWTPVGAEITHGSLSCKWFYIKSASDAMAAPVSTHTSAPQRCCLVWNIGDGDPLAFIDTGFGTAGVASAYDSDTSTDGMDCASSDTTVDNCLVLHVAIADEYRNLEIMPRSMRNLNTIDIGTKLQVCASWIFQEEAGTTPTWKIHNTRSANDALSVCIAIRSDAPLIPARHDPASPQAEILYAANQDGNGGLPYTDTAIASDLGTIDGITTNDASFSDVAGAGFNPYWTNRMLSSSTAGQIATQHYLRDSGVTYDCSGNKICFGIMLEGGQSLSRIEALDNHGVMVGLTSGISPKEIAMWDAGGFETSPIEVQSIVVDANTSIVHEVETFDFTDVRGFVVGAHLAAAANTRVGLDYVHLLYNIVLIGGWDAQGRSASWATAFAAANSSSAKTIKRLGKAYQAKQNIYIGNGPSGNDVCFDDTGEALLTPAAGSVESGNVEFQADAVDVVINVTAASTVRFTRPIVGSGKLNFTVHANTSPDATYVFSGSMDAPKSVTLVDLGAGGYDGYTWSNFPEITHNDADMSGAILDGCTTTQAITLTGADAETLQTKLNRYARTIFRNSSAHGLKLKHTGTGDVPLTAPTGLQVDDLLYDSDDPGSTLTLTTDTTVAIDNTSVADDETVVLVEPAVGIAFAGLKADSLVQVFADGTTTKKFEAASSGTEETWGTTGNQGVVQYVILKEGYLPIRETITVGTSSLSLTINQRVDRAYQASSGLTYTTDTTFDGTEFTLTKATTPQNFYSFYIEQWRSNAAFLNMEFPMVTNGPNSISMLYGVEFDSDAAVDYLSRDGLRYVDSGGVMTAMWAAVQSLSANTDTSGMTAEYQLAAGTTVDAKAAGDVDQLIKLYGDATHGNFDSRDTLVIKMQVNGYREVRVDVVALNDGNDLEDQLYVVSIDPVAIAAATGDPAADITVTDHGASPVTWEGKTWSITITDNGTTSGEDILRELNYNLAQDATYQGKDPFNWPEMVVEAGDAYETIRGVVENGVGATLKGVRVLRGGNPHPDFTRFQADDGTYYVTPEPDWLTTVRLYVPDEFADALAADTAHRCLYTDGAGDADLNSANAVTVIDTLSAAVAGDNTDVQGSAGAYYLEFVYDYDTNTQAGLSAGADKPITWLLAAKGIRFIPQAMVITRTSSVIATAETRVDYNAAA